MKIKVTITRVVDSDDPKDAYWGLEDWTEYSDPDALPDVLLELARNDLLDDVLDNAIWSIEIDPVEPEWLDAPDSEGEWAYTDRSPFNGRVFRRLGYVERLEGADGFWMRGDNNVYSPCSLVKGKWQRLHIAWPSEPQSC